MINLWNNTRLNQVERVLSVNKRMVTWLGHMMWLRKTRANPGKVWKQLFLLRWNFGWKAWWPGTIKIMWVRKEYLDRMCMALRNLKTYGYISSKTKSYQILREFLLLLIFYAFWPYKAGLPCFFDQQAVLLIILLRPTFSGFSKFLDLFPNKSFCWEFLALCPRADRVPTISWIITKCLVIYVAALDFSHSDQINYLTRFMRRTLWRRLYPTVPYLLHPASRVIGYQALLVLNKGYDPKKALD